MENDGKKIDRREFMGKVGMGAAALGVFPAGRLFAASNRVLGANDRIRIGLIGAGDRGQDDLRHALKQPNVECVAVADVYSRRRDQVKGYLPNVATYDDPMRLLERNDIDAVIHATPQHLHKKYFLATLAAGKDLYSEKTLAWNIPEAMACRDAAKSSKQIVQIGMQDQSNGEMEDTRKWIRDGLAGKITMVDSWMSRNTLEGHGQWVRPVLSDCNPDHVNWDLFLSGRPKVPFDGYKFINWRLFWEFSGGNVTENMVHQIGWIINAMDLQLPKAATMTGGVYSKKDGRQVPDTFSVALEYPNDLLVTWQSTFSNSRYGLGERFLGDKGTIEHMSGSNDMKTGVYQKGQPHSDQAIGPTNYYPEKLNNPNGVPLKGENPGVDHMANWMDCIRNRAQPNATVEIGYLSAVACHMSNLAYKQKRRVTLEEAMAAKPEAWM
ncbi:Gfo/Idh/MocA family oxidoreductase [Edaphobacter paludis]|uniref:Gfo/Idh/MocA family oxidoreductase n=1 Tax=Edaphobacter paludis TaxID=3035702 RepID=A0AAU7CTZ5_9BACT